MRKITQCSPRKRAHPKKYDVKTLLLARSVRESRLRSDPGNTPLSLTVRLTLYPQSSVLERGLAQDVLPVTSAQQCLYDPSSDRRRKEYTAGLLKSQNTLCRVAAALRSATPDELSFLVWQVQYLPTDQDAVDYLVQTLG
jgi:hypothetical protein